MDSIYSDYKIVYVTEIPILTVRNSKQAFSPPQVLALMLDNTMVIKELTARGVQQH
jgi:hypothetical protein